MKEYDDLNISNPVYVMQASVWVLSTLCEDGLLDIAASVHGGNEAAPAAAAAAFSPPRRACATDKCP
jgi:hypothetical protein